MPIPIPIPISNSYSRSHSKSVAFDSEGDRHLRHKEHRFVDLFWEVSK